MSSPLDSIEEQEKWEYFHSGVVTGRCAVDGGHAHAVKLTKEIAELDEDISIWEGDIKAATNVREIEKNDYDTLHKDYSESVDALQRAIAVLKKQRGDRKQAFIQVANLQQLSLIPQEAKAAINVFLQDAEPTEGLSISAPEIESNHAQMLENAHKISDELTVCTFYDESECR